MTEDKPVPLSAVLALLDAKIAVLGVVGKMALNRQNGDYSDSLDFHGGVRE